MDQNTSDCSALKIPFSYETDTNNLYFVSDGVAKSLPLEISKPADVTVECDEQPVLVYPGVNVYGCTNSGPITVTYDPPAPQTFSLGSHTVMVTAKDADGNEKSTNFTVTVRDTKPPVLSGQGSNLTIDCPAQPVFTLPTASDTCDASPVVTVSSEVTAPGACPGKYTVTRTWIATDASGNVSQPVSQAITVLDNTPPLLAGVPLNVTNECTAPTAATPTATDGCDANPVVSLSEISTYDSNVNNVGHYNYTITRTWTATDACGNRSSGQQVVTVQDTTPPTPPTLSPATIACGGTATVPPPSGGTDNCGSPVTVTPNTPQTLGGGQTGVSWTFSDVAGNKITVIQPVIETGLTFTGFDSPISGTGGSCSTPIRTINRGSNIAIKFDTKCGGSLDFSGQPTLIIERFDSCGSATTTPPTSPTIVRIVDANFKIVANKWHFNWDTTGSTVIAKRAYKITAKLQDNTTKEVFVYIK